MKIVHFSDTHQLPRKPVPDDCDVIAISGDIAPNKTRGSRFVEPDYQADWYRKTADAWARWANGRPVVLCLGNHDYADPTATFRRAGIDAHNVEIEPVRLHGLLFAGLSDVVWFGGDWNNERHEAEIGERIAARMKHSPDVLVCHSPIHGILDQPFLPASHYANGGSGYHIGSTAIANEMLYGDHEPRAYLHGHCHEQGGKEARIRNTLVSNAATTRRIVVLE